MPDGSYARLAPSPSEATSPGGPAVLGTFEMLMREARAEHSLGSARKAIEACRLRGGLGGEVERNGMGR